MTDPGRSGPRAATPQWTQGSASGYQLQCPNCGLANDPSARFCRNCGLPLGWPDDPVRGTTTRRADLPSERGSGLTAIVGLLAAIALLVGAAYLVFRSNPSGGGIAIVSPSPGSSAHASGSPAASGSGAPSSQVPTDGSSSGSPSEGPTAQPTDAASEAPTDAPTDQPTEAPPTLPPSTGFTCDPATLPDPTNGRWRVSHVDWTSYGKIDEVTMNLVREGDARHGTDVSIESMPLDQVQTDLGLTPPSEGDRAIVITFDGPVRIRSPFDAIPELQAVKTVDVEMDARGVLHTVLGVAGNGCHRLAARTWVDDPTATSAQVVIDVRAH